MGMMGRTVSFTRSIINGRNSFNALVDGYSSVNGPEKKTKWWGIFEYIHFQKEEEERK